jgi:predicted phosphodiesterase
MRFLCFGDWGMMTKSFLSFVKEVAPWYEYCLLLGDNFYPRGVTSLEDPLWNILEYFPEHMKMYGVLGNHDYMGDPIVQLQYTHWKQKIRNWNMDYFYYDKIWKIGQEDTIHFLFLDTQLLDLEYTKEVTALSRLPNEDSLKEQSLRQRQWLIQTLEGSKSRWKIICGHYPIFSNGGHRKSYETSRQLLPIFKGYSVDIYFSGHDHIAEMHQYEKTVHVVSGCVSENRPIVVKWNQGEIFRNPEGDHGVFDLTIIDRNHVQISYISQDKRSTLFSYDLYKF